MKKLLIIFLLINYFTALSQTGTPGEKQASPPVKKYRSSVTQASVLDTHMTCLEKEFSIVFYVVLDSTIATQPNYPGIGLATPSNIDTLMKSINNAFRPICVSFKSCSTVFISNFNYGKTWTKDIVEAHVTAAYYTDKTINFYLVDSVHKAHGNTEGEGYSYEPTPANLNHLKKDVFVLEKHRLLEMYGGTVNHILGHYFGLSHTDEELNLSSPATPPPPSPVVSYEYADGSNCATHGDLICDTEADPGTLIIAKDGKGQYYLHPTDNYMSSYSLRSRFTRQQYNAMTKIIMTKRLYLH